jgi:iron complex outermembrane recepter protein
MNPRRRIHQTQVVPRSASFAAFARYGRATWAACVLTQSLLAAATPPPASLQGLKRLSIEELMDIQVTSVSRSPERLSETASAIQVVTGEEIRRSGATTLAEALRLANNLNVARKNSHDWGISARGFNTDLSNKLLVMIDGRTIYTPLFSGVRWDVQDYLLEDLERVEIISGPGSTLWGANAVNGVINIMTKSAVETKGLFIEGLTGTQLDQGYGVRYGGNLAPTIHYRVYAKYLDRNSETLASGVDARDDWTREQIGFRMDAPTAPMGNLTFQGDHYRGSEGFVTGGRADVSGSNVLGRWSRALTNGSDMSLQLYFDRAHLRQPAPGSTTIMFEDRLDTYDLDFQHRFGTASQQRFVWGLGYRLTDEHSKPTARLAFVPSSPRHELFSGFIQDEISFRPGATLTLGTKVENTHYTGLELEPTVRVQWEVADGNMLWGAISRAVRTPSRIDRDILQPSQPPVILRGGADFASETVWAYEAGYRTQLGGKVYASIATFYNRYDKIRSARPTPTTIIPLTFANDLEGDSYGLEFSSAFQALEWWRVIASYNLLQSDVHVKSGRVDFNNALNENADPKHQASLRSSMDFRPGIEFDANFRWVDEILTNNVGRPSTIPGYVELDVRLGYRLGSNWEFAISGRNLLDRAHPEFGPSGPTRVEIGRSVHAKVAVRF